MNSLKVSCRSNDNIGLKRYWNSKVQLISKNAGRQHAAHPMTTPYLGISKLQVWWFVEKAKKNPEAYGTTAECVRARRRRRTVLNGFRCPTGCQKQTEYSWTPLIRTRLLWGIPHYFELNTNYFPGISLSVIYWEFEIAGLNHHYHHHHFIS